MQEALPGRGRVAMWSWGTRTARNSGRTRGSEGILGFRVYVLLGTLSAAQNPSDAFAATPINRIGRNSVGDTERNCRDQHCNAVVQSVVQRSSCRVSATKGPSRSLGKKRSRIYCDDVVVTTARGEKCVIFCLGLVLVYDEEWFRVLFLVQTCWSIICSLPEQRGAGAVVGRVLLPFRGSERIKIRDIRCDSTAETGM